MFFSVRIAMATVYIWSSNIINKRPGHASLLLDTGTYISFWPQDKNKSKLFKTWFAVSQVCYNKSENQNYHTVRTILKSNIKIVKRQIEVLRNKVVIRSRTIQCVLLIEKGHQDKQWSTKHYVEN